jgi:two-component system, NtrC family, nitrogen regulation response regulator GlnG
MPNRYGSVDPREDGDAGDDATSGNSSTSMSGDYRLNAVPATLLDTQGPAQERLPLWERGQSGSTEQFLAVARPHSGITTLISVGRRLAMRRRHTAIDPRTMRHQPERDRTTAEPWAGSWYTRCSATRSVVAVANGSPVPGRGGADPPDLATGSRGAIDTMTHISALPVLLVDDDPQVLHSASIVLRSSGVAHVITVEDSRAVMPLLAEQEVGVLVLDLTMPHIAGHALLEQVSGNYPDIPVILMTATNDLETAVQCMQIGASDYLVKPVEESRLVSSVKRALEMRTLRAEVLSLKEHLLTGALHQREAFAEIITQSKAMFAIFRYLEAIALSPQPVLITGETGTGKELVARALHRLSARPGELVAVNVAGLDDTMFSDTLFGHTRGAFTGADQARDGVITSTAEGTLFLDEIGDLSVASQVKLLRLLQDGTYYPLGADRPRQSQARIVCATNGDVAQGLTAGTFRKDLYYRLRTHHLHLPALRARRGDLPLLVHHFVDQAARALAKTAPTEPLALYQLLNTYSFPGNVRELEALVFDAVARHQGTILSLHSFKEAIAGEPRLAASELPEEPSTGLTAWFPEQLPTFKAVEEALLTEALRRADGNQGVAAVLLGISRQALNKRLRRRQASGHLAEPTE